MDMTSGVTLGTLLLTLVVLFVTGGIGWGTLLQRVKTLEKEVEALSDFSDRLTRIEEKTTYVAELIETVTKSWLFLDPPPSITFTQPVPKRRRSVK